MRGLAVAVAAAAVAGALVPAAGAKPTVSPADRAAIDRVLDVFVPTAIGRRHSERAWTLVTPTLHLGSSIADWKRGFLPVIPFPVKGTSFHGWTVDSVGKNRADLSLLLHLRKGAPIGGVAESITMRKLGGRWLVASVVPAATFAAPGSDSQILAQPDFAPQPGQAFSKTGRISQKWVLIIPGILFGLIVLTPVAVLAAHRVNDRRRPRNTEADRERVFRNQPDRPN